MIKNTLVRILFLIAALYDGVLGTVFLFMPAAIFEKFEVTPPNHMGYVQFSAALLLIFTLMFVRVAVSPTAHRHLIVYGILLKVAFCGLAFWYWATEGIPGMWKPFAVADVVMAALFVWAWTVTKPK
jgi:hypothetical protein